MSFVTVEISETDINWQITTLTLFLKECSMELRMVHHQRSSWEFLPVEPSRKRSFFSGSHGGSMGPCRKMILANP